MPRSSPQLPPPPGPAPSHPSSFSAAVPPGPRTLTPGPGQSAGLGLALLGRPSGAGPAGLARPLPAVVCPSLCRGSLGWGGVAVSTPCLPPLGAYLLLLIYELGPP